MLKFKRPSGSTIEVADTEANIEYAEANKWARYAEVKAPKKTTKKS